MGATRTGRWGLRLMAAGLFAAWTATGCGGPSSVGPADGSSSSSSSAPSSSTQAAGHASGGSGSGGSSTATSTGPSVGMTSGGSSSASSSTSSSNATSASSNGATSSGASNTSSNNTSSSGTTSSNSTSSTSAASSSRSSSSSSSGLAVPGKVDLLFDIDNSASMGDKQAYLIQAIPDLINRLLNPDCLDAAGNPVLDTNGVPVPSADGVCPDGDHAEFAPVHDLHLGVVTSSLGSRLSDAPAAKGASSVILCGSNAAAQPPFSNLSAHNDDQGHLVARSLAYSDGGATATEGVVGDAVVPSYVPTPSGFLDWYPAATASGPNPLPSGLEPVASTMALESDFADLVGGVGIFGCGIESQLESWYRFLVQPDPYASLVLDGNGDATWSGVDATVLQERADFLRPDSLVAVIDLTDEDDSEIDVRSFAGEGYVFMGQGWNPIRGTSACATNPADPACQSCSSAPDASADPACSPLTYTAENDWGFDPNLRHAHMKEKYGLDPQYPWQRYVVGLTQTMVPDRSGEYPPGAQNYVGTADCTNPLFAAQLPSGAALASGTMTAATLCNLPAGARSPNLVFFAIIGGVPNQLLHFAPNNSAASELTPADWTRILGEGPASQAMGAPDSYDYTGIDPHMIVATQDRTTLTGIQTDSSMTHALAPADSSVASDPVSGREWTTSQPYTATPAPGQFPYSPHVLPVDLQYACIFPLSTPRDCTLAQNAYDCDCPSVATGLTADEIPPVCSPSNPTVQVAAKGYPTVRELQVARLMAHQGIVASICPIHLTDTTGNDPLYGYRPAVAPLIDRLRGVLP